MGDLTVRNAVPIVYFDTKNHYIMSNEYLSQLIAELDDRVHALEELTDKQSKKIKDLEEKVAELESDLDDAKNSIDDLTPPGS